MERDHDRPAADDHARRGGRGDRDPRRGARDRRRARRLVTLLSTVHTADLERSQREELHAFLVDAFGGDFADEDFEHALGGLHVLLREGDALIAHASVVQRQLLHGELAIRTGYVEAVAVRRDRRGRGHGRAVMAVAERVIVAAYDLGALSTRLEGFYERSGWVRWLGPTCVLSPAGLTRTEEDDGGVLVLRTPTSPELDLTGPLACDWRSGDVW